ncbi:epidermal retinol dehydrogenase 2 isoform X3 [Myotis myotis]|uniref:epidermal retinol dehydrogenase 2 isoform X3 n=1 Tax=Myotis myotis TaxID=51298 RepID=UPI00174B91DB|nr:epidermal retinol dehydrogenase 2 isoform X3 [Myotis myotis]
MAPNVKSAKKVFVFLGKSVFSLLETMIFTLIPKPRKNVAGEIVLITGAGSGLGRLLALKFARLGAVLVLWDINKEGNEETCNMARDAGATRAYAYTCDCSRKEEVYRVADQTYKAFLPAMIANAHGHLVCISSSAGLFGINGLADYCASKFSAYGFAESIFFELFAQKIKGIKTTIVCPFFINTGMFEGCTTGCPSLLPILEPEYVVRKIVDAILQEKVYLYIPKFIYVLMFLKSRPRKKDEWPHFTLEETEAPELSNLPAMTSYMTELGFKPGSSDSTRRPCFQPIITSCRAALEMDVGSQLNDCPAHQVATAHR